MRNRAYEESRTGREEQSTIFGLVRLLTSRALMFLAPLAIFLPRQKPITNSGEQGKDWSLALVATAYGTFTLVKAGLYGYKLQYAIFNFGWSSVELGIWLTFIGIGRAFNLCVVVPLVTRYITGKRPSMSLPTDPPESQSLLPNSESHNPPPSQHDLTLARISVAIEFCCYVLILLSIGPKSWTVGTQLTSFSTGFEPFSHSLALSLIPGGENKAGALFGGLSVLQALCSGIFGPFIFGTIYVHTVTTLPKAIFAVGLLLLAVALALLCSLRLSRTKISLEEYSNDAGRSVVE